MDLSGIKNIVFDFGGVLVNLNQQACMDELTRLGVPNIEDYLTAYGHVGIFGAFENGDVDLPTFCRGVREQFHLDCEDIDVENAWAKFLENIPYKKLKLVYALSKKYRIFILSNTNPIHIKSFSLFDQAGFPYKECVEKPYYSFQIRHSKPSLEIFRHVTDDAGILPEETLLVDDSPKNCAAAASLGWKTYCPGTSEDFCEDLFPEETAYIMSEDFQAPPFQACVATMGFFDGVHQGHKFLINKLQDLADKKRMPSLLLAFWPHPRKVLQADYCPQLLSTQTEKKQALRQTAADKVEILPFTAEMSVMSARDFMEKILRDTYHVRCLLMGHDHHFGKDGRQLQFEDYQRYGQELGIEVLRAEPYYQGQELISSSFVRAALQSHDIEAANAALGYAYFLQGKVCQGYGNGKKMGFPTANIRVEDENKLIPARGVYAVRVFVGEENYLGMLNIGTRPTLCDGGEASIEVHIFDFDQDIYHQNIRIEFLHYLREERPFASLDELQARLAKDRATILADFS